MPYQLTETDIAWLAGLLEGEGNFGLHEEQKGNWIRCRPMIQLMMTDYDVVLHVAGLFNRDHIGTRQLPSGKVAYRVFLEGESAIKMMKRLHPHMFGRRAAKIQEILDFWNGSSRCETKLPS